jgi:putative peptidoglycan lipid II flippase
MAEERGMMRSASAMSITTMLSRILGYFRDNLQATILGAANVSDAFIIAYRIPNLLRRLVGEGALTSAFVPTFSRYLKEGDPEKLWRFANRMFFTLLVVLTGITLLGIAFSPQLVKILAYGFRVSPDKWDLTIQLNRLMFPYIFFISLAALASGILNSMGSFALPAFTPVLLNLAIIVAALFFSRSFSNPAYAFAWGVLVGGLLQFLVQVPSLIRRGMTFQPEVSFSDPGIRQVGRLMLPRIFGAGITQINLIVDSQFASSLAAGSVSHLYYAGRVTELTLGIFAISLSTVILPTLSRLVAEDKPEEVRQTLRTALQLIFFICVPAAVGLIVLRVPIISVLFERGKFDAQATLFTSQVLGYYSVGLLPFAGVNILAAAFYAHQDTRTPVKIGALTFFIHLALNFYLRGPLLAGGIALSTSISAILDMVLLFYLFSRKWGPLWDSHLGRSLWVTSAASLVMGGVSVLMLRLQWLQSSHSILIRVSALTLAISVAGGCFFVVAWLLDSREVKEVFALFPFRKGRGR